MNRKIMYLLTLFIMVMMLRHTSTAAESGEQVLMETQRETNVYEKADMDSSVVITLEKGTPVICCDAAGSDGWYEIRYQDVMGYALHSDFGIYGDVDGIDEGFQDIAEENIEQFGKIQEEQMQKKSESFWGGIMVSLIALMFAAGVYAVMKNRKKRDKGVEL